MAIPFLSTLGLGLRRVGQTLTGAVARTARSTVQAVKTGLSGIRAGVARGVSDSVIGTALRRAGVDIPGPTLTRVVTTERRRREAAQALKFLARNRRPNPTRLPLSLTPIARNFSFLVSVTGDSVSTGEAVQRWITISTDAVLSRSQIEERAESMFLLDPGAYDIRTPRFTLEEGMRASDVQGFIPTV